MSDRNPWYCTFCGVSSIPVGDECPICGRWEQVLTKYEVLFSYQVTG